MSWRFGPTTTTTTTKKRVSVHNVSWCFGRADRPESASQLPARGDLDVTSDLLL